MTEVQWLEIQRLREDPGHDRCIPDLHRTFAGVRPRVGFNGRTTNVARVLLEMPHDDPRQALHLCGNAWCISVAHVYRGTPRQNSRDSMRHGVLRPGGSSDYLAESN